MFTVPDKGEGANDIQSILFQEHLDILVAGIAGKDCVLSGCAVTAQGSPDMTVAVAKGAVLANGVLKPVTAGNVTIGTADGTNPRLDLIVADSTGAKQCRAGTAAAAPKPPVRSANDVVLAVVYVPASDTTIASNQITDLRVVRDQGPIVIDKVTTRVVFNTTSSIQTYYSLVVPNGLLLAGKVFRVRLGGTILANSGTPTFTLTVSFGGTTLHASTSGGFGADPDPRSWDMDLSLVAQGNADQELSGLLVWTGTALPTAPTTGRGNVGQGGGGIALGGVGAVDADAADGTFTIQWTMSVSNAAVETVMEFAVATVE